jgi:hypothetical protein
MILNYISALLFVGQLFCSGGCGGAAGGGVVVPSQNNFRLTLATGFPVYAPAPATPASTDTSAETVTFSTAPGWTTGTIVTVSTTSGGLTAGTRYYLNAASTTVFSFHTTVANAEAGTSKVNLTGNVNNAEIRPSGVSATTMRLSPYTGKHISLYYGGTWTDFMTAEISLSLGTLTSGFNYDAFAYSSDGTTVTMEFSTSWGSDTVRTSTTLTTQDGVYVKGTDSTRRYLGTFRTDSNTTTIDDAGFLTTQVGGKRFVWNASNRVAARIQVFDSAAWTYGVNLVRQANGNTGNKVEGVWGLSEDPTDVAIHQTASDNAGSYNFCIGIDSTTAYRYECMYNQVSTGAGIAGFTSRWIGVLPIGYHAIDWLENSPGTNGSVPGNDAVSRSGLIAITRM